MEIEIRVPSVGESVQQGLLAQWHRKDGERVRKDEALFTVETDKITFEVTAEADGILKVLVAEGETVSIGAVVGRILAEAAGEKVEPPPPRKEPLAQAPPPAPPPTSAPPPPPGRAVGEEQLAPAVRRLAAERQVDLSEVAGTGPGGRVTKGDVLLHLEGKAAKPEQPPPAQAAPEPSPGQAFPAAPPAADATTRKAMSPIRRRIAERLLEARRNTAMLTTFNEVDMSRVQSFRGEFRETFKKRYGVSLGITSFFVKASVEALREFPEVNAFIDGDDIVYHHYYHIGIAVGAERGLVVPVVRDADRLSFAEIEQAVGAYVRKIGENRLELADLEGGTFTITNGGVYGSLLSTPILNTPQSGILGLHKIEDRPVAAGGQVVVRPMMYVALSYDHRIVDGRQAVTFLRRVKECMEEPERLLVGI